MTTGFRTGRRFLLMMAIGLLLAVGVEPSRAGEPGAGKEVRPARPTWDTGWFYTEIYMEALRRLGYKVAEVKTLENPVFYQAVAQGDVDVWFDGYFPIHDQYKNFFEGKARPIGYIIKGGSLQGYLIDKKTADAHHIGYLEDFKRPEIAKLFDSQGTGIADLVACPPGWGCEVDISYQLKAYGLENTVHPIKAAYNAAMADALARYKEGNPIFFYTWTPNWTLALLKPDTDVVWLQAHKVELPKAEEQYASTTTVPNVTGCADNPCHMPLTSSDIRSVANDQFLAKNPAVAKFLEVASIPLADVLAQNAEMYKGQNKPDDLKRQVLEWIHAHQATFDGWLAEARKAAM